MKILVVEDNQINQKVALHILRGDVAANGQEAVAAIKTIPLKEEFKRFVEQTNK